MVSRDPLAGVGEGWYLVYLGVTISLLVWRLFLCGSLALGMTSPEVPGARKEIVSSGGRYDRFLWSLLLGTLRRMVYL